MSLLSILGHRVHTDAFLTQLIGLLHDVSYQFERRRWCRWGGSSYPQDCCRSAFDVSRVLWIYIYIWNFGTPGPWALVSMPVLWVDFWLERRRNCRSRDAHGDWKSGLREGQGPRNPGLGQWGWNLVPLFAMSSWVAEYSHVTLIAVDRFWLEESDCKLSTIVTSCAFKECGVWWWWWWG